jgi:hypothetical protein
MKNILEFGLKVQKSNKFKILLGKKRFSFD